ncbi:aminodeoxychorismate synthase component I [Martelella mediterranea]|uniref:Para-aminobenzoate synthase component 1 n=1 Tax=Martelella mediterranea DSM 17316 TaxID=1122214 RepID=A0A1U9YYS6_9HYPH|nr:aminodeoxychorismate synthase component I [Martelella mediterranea]AQZ50596.1 Para-aminobenzoate synthase component 1 [Martelella mediterranea DSM 17316]
MTRGQQVVFCDDLSGRMLSFRAPEDIIVAETAEDFIPALQRMEAARASGRFLAGYMSYEAGFLLEPALASLAPESPDLPFLCFGVFDAPEQAAPPALQPETGFLTDIRPAWSFEDYRPRFERLHAHLMAGDCYQGNLTFPVHARWRGDPLSAFHGLARQQPVRYATFVDLAGPRILSRSPELFFRADANGMIETHPMKGTAPRGGTPAEDAAIIAAMGEDDKMLAENCMIVDLLRNDMSRIAEPGSVHVPKLFEIETYPTLHQMVSKVRARLHPDTTIEAIFRALFPCGSITGAPKISAMKILHRLEGSQRGAYCGAIGHIAPDGAMQFNVAIRTVSLYDDGRAIFNVGGGVVLDSTGAGEYEEALLKARFAAPAPFSAAAE